MADAKRADTDPQARPTRDRDRRAPRCSTPCCSRTTSPRSSTTAAVRDAFADVLPPQAGRELRHDRPRPTSARSTSSTTSTSGSRRSGDFGAAEVYGGGLRVYTTLDCGMQAAASTRYQSTLGRTDRPGVGAGGDRRPGPRQGHGGGPRLRRLQVNLAVGRATAADRAGQAGSTFKAVRAGRGDAGRASRSSRRSTRRRQITIPEGRRGQGLEGRQRRRRRYGAGQPGRGHGQTRSTPSSPSW